MKAYISYRRADSIDFAGRLVDRLASHFGPGNILMDFDAVPLGADFTTVLTQEIRQCDVVLVVIGPKWLDVRGTQRQRRLDEPNDLVRIEIESAIALSIPIVPVLIGSVQLPSFHELPQSLGELAYRNAVVVQPGTEFHHDLDRLIRALQNLTKRLPPDRPTERSQPIPDIDPNELKSNQVFVSHSTLDRKWVELEIIQFLDQNGVQVWYAQSSITTSAQWEREILRGLEACDWFLLVVSPRAADSEWVKDELFWAMHHRPTRIVPAIMQRCDLWQFHIRLPRIQHVDFTYDRQEARRLLLESLNR